jgi:hypothetical protein
MMSTTGTVSRNSEPNLHTQKVRFPTTFAAVDDTFRNEIAK